jgi:hypothetical protein
MVQEVSLLCESCFCAGGVSAGVYGRASVSSPFARAGVVERATRSGQALPSVRSCCGCYVRFLYDFVAPSARGIRTTAQIIRIRRRFTAVLAQII